MISQHSLHSSTTQKSSPHFQLHNMPHALHYSFRFNPVRPLREGVTSTLEMRHQWSLLRIHCRNWQVCSWLVENAYLLQMYKTYKVLIIVHYVSRTRSKSSYALTFTSFCTSETQYLPQTIVAVGINTRVSIYQEHHTGRLEFLLINHYKEE